MLLPDAFSLFPTTWTFCWLFRGNMPLTLFCLLKNSVFGGGQMGRGNDPSEITGDKGIAATIEIRKNITLPKFDAAIQGYTFYDFGKVWNIDPSAKDRISAASSGVGVRVGLSSGWSADLNAAIPLTKNPENPPKYVNGQSPRILFSLQKKI